MNIFYLDRDPVKAARMHSDRPPLDHLGKMILEYAQMLCTAHRVLDGRPALHTSKSGARLTRYLFGDRRDSVYYRDTHRNHPSAAWVRQSAAHYQWLYACFAALCGRYTEQRGKPHATDTALRGILRKPPANLPDNGFRDPPQCINEQLYPNCRAADAVQAYRNYYKLKMSRAARAH